VPGPHDGRGRAAGIRARLALLTAPSLRAGLRRAVSRPPAADGPHRAPS
jgi:hypothetical protein